MVASRRSCTTSVLNNPTQTRSATLKTWRNGSAGICALRMPCSIARLFPPLISNDSDTILPRNLRPMRLSRRPEPFDHADWILELKLDRFRSLAYIENDQCDLVSLNGNTFRNFKDLAQWIGENLRVENAVLDGELASA